MNRRPEYTYKPKGSGWTVYRMTYQGVFTTGTPVVSFQKREEARKECYRLNGWTYKKTEKI